MSEELKPLPCAFCGTEPEIRKIGNVHTKMEVTIRCPECRVERTDATPKVRNHANHDWLVAVAVKNWNRRASPSPASDAADKEWRRLALQFDGHRMLALGHLRMMIDHPELHAPVAAAFLAAPPPSGTQVLSERILELAASTRTASDTRTAAGEAHPYHRDLEGLNEFINGFCQGDARLIACAEAAWYRCIGRNHALNHAAGEAECDAARRAAPAGQQDAGGVVLSALRDGIPLQEPVYINKALRAQREARVSLSGGTGPQACVMLVNIQLTGWIHTKDTAEAYAEGYNRGRKDYRSALLELAAQTSRDAAAGSAREGGNTQPVSVESTRPAEVDVEAERPLFEAWATANGFKVERREDAASPDTYFRYETEQRWIVWLAARTQADAGREHRIGPGTTSFTVSELEAHGLEMYWRGHKRGTKEATTKPENT